MNLELNVNKRNKKIEKRDTKIEYLFLKGIGLLYFARNYSMSVAAFDLHNK